MSSRIWDVSVDGQIEFVSLTAQLLDGAVNVMRNAFFLHESVSIAIDLVNNPEAISELDGLTLNAAKDGVSIAAVEKSTGNVIGVALNKLQVENDGEEEFLRNYLKSCKHSSSRSMLQYMIDADATTQLFDLCNIDCILEIMFLATLPQFRRKGIAKKLCEISIEVAKQLKNRDNVKQPVEPGKMLPLEPVPQIVYALFTSPISQRIGRALNFDLVERQSYEEYFHEGKSYAEVLGKEIPDTTAEYLRI